MKRFARLFLNLFFLCLTSFIFAQQPHAIRSGGFGGVSFQSTSLSGSWGLGVGGFGAGYLNNNFYFGGGGFGLEVEADEADISLGYGGI
ncbi:MAG: hypothetical protein AAF696_00695 [Bacteroidota bacterium]